MVRFHITSSLPHNIVQDYLTFRNYEYERLDGSVRNEERKLALKKFKEEDVMVFLLSTRAGGLGLNLTNGSIVIFYIVLNA